MRALIRQNRRLFLYLISANLLLAFGHRIWQAVFTNFAVEQVGVGPDAIGWIQSARELPGLLAFGVALLALVLSELRIMAVSVVLLGLGILLTGLSGTVPTLVVATLVMSIGFHFFNPSSNSALMMSVRQEEAPKTLGLFRSIGAGAGALATVAVWLLAERIGYRDLFFGVGIAVMLGGALLFAFGRGEHNLLPLHRRIRLRRRYGIFYALSFLMGSRRHIFTTFAPFLLVRDHAVAVQMMATLYFVNSLINTYAYQRIGKWVGRIGERRVLSIAFAALIPVFLGYAFVGYLPILFALFIVDNLLFGCNIGLTTYIQKIAASSEELTSNLALQETINHISAVIVPVVGGTVWVLFGSQAPFLFGVGIATISLVLAQWIRVRGDAPASVGAEDV